MAVDFLNYILVMLLAGAGSFGGGVGGANIIKEFAVSWASSPELAGEVVDELLNVISVSQFGGYSQSIILSIYLGMKTELGFLGAVLGILAFVFPSIIIIAIIMKIGEKLYKNSVFKNSIKYMNLLGAGLICMLLWNYLITIFGIDLMYPLIAGLACFVGVYFKVNPAFIVIGGGIIGAIWRA